MPAGESVAGEDGLATSTTKDLPSATDHLNENQAPLVYRAAANDKQQRDKWLEHSWDLVLADVATVLRELKGSLDELIAEVMLCQLLHSEMASSYCSFFPYADPRLLCGRAFSGDFWTASSHREI